MSSKKARGILLHTDGNLTEVVLDVKNGCALDSLQALIGGYVQYLPRKGLKTHFKGCSLYIDEEGVLKNCKANPFNARIKDPDYPWYFDFMGNIVVVVENSKGEVTDMPPSVSQPIKDLLEK